MKSKLYPLLAIAFTLSLSALLAVPSPASALTITRPLAFGSTGSDVSALQQFLKDQGYFTYPSITEYYGGFTWRAVAAFQYDHGLESVGNVGPKTRALIAALTASTSTTPNTTTTTSSVGTTTSEPAATSTATTTNNYMPGITPLPGYAPNEIIFGGGSAPAATCSISATPTNIAIGSSTLLTWSSSNASSASINNGIGSVATAGSQSASPTVTTTYTLSVTGSGGSSTCSTS